MKFIVEWERTVQGTTVVDLDATEWDDENPAMAARGILDDDPSLLTDWVLRSDASNEEYPDYRIVRVAVHPDWIADQGAT